MALAVWRASYLLSVHPGAQVGSQPMPCSHLSHAALSRRCPHSCSAILGDLGSTPPAASQALPSGTWYSRRSRNRTLAGFPSGSLAVARTPVWTRRLSQKSASRGCACLPRMGVLCRSNDNLSNFWASLFTLPKPTA